ncbi:MAG TPA: hypothetical protein VMV51_11695 [Gemmatimonadaceae bacterium]|nr:hypothetical protein [Gemmatimonadaceae bacterium]
MRNRPDWAVVVAMVACIAVTASAHAQDVSQVVALHSFKDLPTLPTSIDSLAKYYGDVGTPDGQTEKGDLRTEALRQRIAGWMKPAGVPPGMDYSGMMQGPGAMNPAAAQAIGNLSQVAGQMTTDLTGAMQSFNSVTMARLHMAFEDKVDMLNRQYQPAIDRCMARAERAGGGSCGSDPAQQRDAAINAAAAGLLKSAAAPYDDLKHTLQQSAAQGEAAIDQATKAFGGKLPGIARAQVMMIRQNELNELMGALGAENDVVTYVFAHAANLKEGGGTH